MILIMGHPNAGKTMYSSRYDKVLHLDDFPHNKFLYCNAAVRWSDGNIVVEGIYNLRCRRIKLLEALKGKNTERICIWIDTPIEECLRRESRGRNEEIVRDPLQPPTLDEGWDEIIQINSEGE